MKIVQIAPVVEYRDVALSTDKEPYNDATVYGLGDDGLLYVWGVVKTTRIDHKSENEMVECCHEAYHYDKEYGWRPVRN